ncbi:MBL fold metallo-hydrolase [Parashewanella tropica]|uniref:MBL fold metallo-hydrolase n=1 Tax=Parashewanella tropica TaxID=2547970 RepID=UPI0010593174|nr:MBL fold metallo-hydrolase [Parashewanella tropica]
MEIKTFFHRSTGTLSYLMIDGEDACVIDSVLDYDGETQSIRTNSVEAIVEQLEQRDLNLTYILETHIHADHLSAASYLRARCGGKIVVSNNIKQVYKHWKPKLNGHDLADYDLFIDDSTHLPFNSTQIEVIATPGHTPDSLTYKIEDHLFVGDTLFAPSRGTSRVDFPDGSAEQLFHSIHKLYDFPPHYHIHLCHDYPKEGKKPIYEVTVQEEKEANVMLNSQCLEHEYIEKRQNRDAQLSMPKLIEIAVPFNLTYQLPRQNSTVH